MISKIDNVLFLLYQHTRLHPQVYCMMTVLCCVHSERKKIFLINLGYRTNQNNNHILDANTNVTFDRNWKHALYFIETGACTKDH